MKAAYATSFSPEFPLDALVFGERPEPRAAAGWSTVSVRAAALNGHDIWALRGIGLPAEALPRVLGSDAAGTDEHGVEVVIYPVITMPGSVPSSGIDPTTDSLLSEQQDGTFAERVLVPTANLLPKPAHMSYEQAAALPTAWLTAYRMLFSLSNASPGQIVLVQGSSGGVASALLTLGSAAGYRMWATGRTAAKRELALRFGAEHVFEPSQWMPQRVDAVMETVGAATWDHSMKVLRPGGTLVVAGATAGHLPPLALRRVFSLGLRIIGTRMGTLEEMRRLLAFCELKDLAPSIDSIFPLVSAREAFVRLNSGDAAGKILVIP
ncbi:NADPH:quinone reductase [Cryobacterium flavum]|uniref:NADPH:quinone reductase n=1 Tax=Cryobacterium flavum TaxID=1424659 RepID=A0A4R8UXQ8_9MICO|nr:zinc-binding dehydrogenase [Cryobacterium flavum]TFB73614.1 Zn-dependent oxidoreductase [Cryobacterium flavum]SDO32673.1 NADPH:quinone reductase [Cryobacterium flavum]